VILIIVATAVIILAAIVIVHVTRRFTIIIPPNHCFIPLTLFNSYQEYCQSFFAMSVVQIYIKHRLIRFHKPSWQVGMVLSILLASISRGLKLRAIL
jgi:hypothetical protein